MTSFNTKNIKIGDSRLECYIWAIENAVISYLRFRVTHVWWRITSLTIFGAANFEPILRESIESWQSQRPFEYFLYQKSLWYLKLNPDFDPNLVELWAQSAVTKMSILLLWNRKCFFISPFCHKSDYNYLHVLQHWYSNEMFPFQNFAFRRFRKPVQIFSCLISAWQIPFFFHRAYHHYL